jgi:hydrogenase expression/formation protein HypD
MKHLNEYRDPALARDVAAAIRRAASREWAIMEICGGQTHSIVRNGLDTLLDGKVRLIHGPGCPVCVTSAAAIDHALEIAARPEVILCSFGDMLRVPGSNRSLLHAKSEGADIRILYSPLDAVKVARDNPTRQVVFFAVGFETTTPVHATAVLHAERQGLTNLTLLNSHTLVPPALDAILSAEGCEVQGILAAGHVCTVAGWREYEPIAARRRVPIVVTGFEPIDLLNGILAAVGQLESGRAEVENRYARAVRPDGNPLARENVRRVFEVCDREWRGIGVIPGSGLRLRPEYSRFDAALRFPAITIMAAAAPTDCIAGLVLQGRAKPSACPSFGTACTPDRPLGAPMVSSEGACAAYYTYALVPHAH